MADHTPPLESGQLLSPELPILASPPPPAMVNGEGPQQVILVQVNPGEAFTIRREDGQFQCITGPAQVPMMSPNGSVPPIYVPPGYISQIIEENGVRRVLVLPQQPEFHPGGHSPLHHPPPPPHAHLPAFIPHPAMMPPPPHLYTGMAGSGDMSSQYISQYHPAHIYSEQVSADSHSQHGRPAFVHRDDRTTKTYERLQKKLKERQGGGGGQVKDSPPPSPLKTRGSPLPQDVRNGVGAKGPEAEQGQPSHTADRQTGRGRNGEAGELDAAAQALQALLSTISKPAVSDIQARGAAVSWSAPTRPESENSTADEGSPPGPLSYEVSVSFSSKDGKYKSMYCGEELSATLENLRPATDYHVRVQAMCNCLQGSPSEAVSFTTLSCEPEPPNPPRKASGTKNTLVLQWKAPCDNGSKVQNYILQWDEGKASGVFEQCYYGPQKQYRLTKLSPASRYCFRIAAKNDLGVSEFSEVVDLFTSCSVPQPPFPPELEMAGVTWLCLKWQRPSGSPKEDDVYYILEMEEEGSGYGFQPSYDGEELSCTVRNLHRSTKYKFRVAAYNSEGKSNPSPVVEFITNPDRPSYPSRPVVKGKVLPTSFRLGWEPPKESGGAQVTKYVVELSEGLSGLSWELVYSGPSMEYTCDGLKPGYCYQTRVYCMSEGGQSPVSETLQVQTPPVPPGPCQPPRLVGKPKAREVQLRWGPPQVDGGSPVSCYSVELSGPLPEESREVYQGPELDCFVGGLMPGRTYGFRLKAGNKAGFGPFSERYEVTTGPGAPEQCKVPSTTCRSPSCVVVSWEAPPCNGAPVSEFRLEWGAAEGSMQVGYSGPALSYEMKGLLPATNYFCRVQAVNVAGVGPFSEALLCQTPCSVPAAVSSISAMRESELMERQTPDDAEDDDKEDEEGDCARPEPLYSPSTCVGICWDPPCDHGSEITSYLIDLGERQPILVGRVSQHIIQHLQPDTSYRIRIQALNSLGAGPFSHTFKLKTKPLPPQPPRLECTAFSHQTLRLKWGDGPAKAATSDALQYQLQMEDKSGRFLSLYKGTCHTHKVQRLIESTSYAFRIQAFNEAGEGPFSSVYTFTTPRSPPAPLKAPKVERLDDNSCEVTWETLAPMKGDPIIYALQSMMGNSEFKQAYKGSAASFTVPHLHANSDYRFRVCAIRQCQDAPELSGPYSPTVTLPLQRPDAAPGGSATASSSSSRAETSRAGRSLTDEQCAFLLLMVFSVIAILIAFIIQYFVIK
uniref:fibronectin type-III domain-containing protein 3A isoform X2 n=1 Tax=Doryrhamphus excisus TaxID=161450 RepID=UPI0025AE4E87|nr:fibronectin type-III domain-containing protein 3A isoform X2 [Doryrhamphus excisus]XP_057935078.1 fibronectin type-III domain-containing protein 3A isoform X2 [Doryrhamphus excisus]XP_057935079.1 fibronectin type-III domain-containing protein 3A isoform X2 [Doryrhamphus excisus]XP_057935080.1 fibronectin type-III domain-containing protein 3A isoform X2 [Doryrhamphus excisus]